MKRLTSTLKQVYSASLTFSLLAFNFSLASAQTQPWQMVHGSAQRRGYANVTGPQTNHLKWKYQLTASTGGGENSIAISNTGIVYVGGPNQLTALDRNGKLKWKQAFTGVQGPCLSNDGLHVYFVSDSNIVCCDSNGAKCWAYKMGGSGIFGPTLSADGKTLYQGCWDHYEYAITTAGVFKWRFLTHGCVSYQQALTPGGSVIVGGGDAHCGTDSLLYSLNPILGDTNWTLKGPSNHWGGPVIGRNGLIYATNGPAVYVLDTLGKVKWKIGAPANVAGLVVCIYGDTTANSTTIYTGVFNSHFYSVSSATKDTTWDYVIGKDPSTNKTGVPCFPVCDNKGDVYFGGCDYNVYGLNKSGTKLWSYKTGGEITEASPAIDPANGTLYVTSEDGYLYAFADSTVTTDLATIADNVELQLMPNPSNGVITVNSNEEVIVSSTAEVYNILGEKIQSFKIQSSTFKIDISDKPNGIYFLRIQFTDGSSVVRRIEVLK